MLFKNLDHILQIVLATCHSAGSRQLANMYFDVVCIDEACQALEAVSYMRNT